MAHSMWEIFMLISPWLLGFPGGSDGKESTCNAGDLGSIPGLGRTPGGGNGNPLQYSCLENPMDRGTWQTIVHWFIKSQTWGGWSQDGGGIGRGDHFLHHKFIKRSFECWPTCTQQLLKCGGGHQAPRKAPHSLQKEVGQNIKDKKRDKRVRDGDLSWQGGVVKEEKFPNSRRHCHQQVCGEFWNLRGQHNGGEKPHRICT